MAASGPIKELEIVRFRGQPYFVGRGSADPDEQRLVSSLTPDGAVFERFPGADLIDAAVEAMPGIGVRGFMTLNEYDSYYYDPMGTASLPVLRVEYADPQQTARTSATEWRLVLVPGRLASAAWNAARASSGFPQRSRCHPAIRSPYRVTRRFRVRWFRLWPSSR